MVADIYPGNSSSSPFYLWQEAGISYWSMNDGVHGWELFRSDGTAGGTYLVKDMFKGKGSSMSYLGVGRIGNRAVFSAYDTTKRAGRELWISDGTTQGTFMLKDLEYKYSGAPMEFYCYGGLVFFCGFDSLRGRELWCTDGTQSGTRRLSDIYTGPKGSDPHGFCGFGEWVYFAAEDTAGVELWRVSADAQKLEFMDDINPGVLSSDPRELTVFNNALYFRATTATDGDGIWYNYDYGQFNYSGKLRDILDNPSGAADARELTVYKDQLFFSAKHAQVGYELWKSDLSHGEVYSDINTGAFSSDPEYLTVVQDLLYFSADNGYDGKQFWVSDGTPDHVAMLDKIGEDREADVADITVSGNYIYMRAFTHSEGAELWAYRIPDWGVGSSFPTENTVKIFPNPAQSTVFIQTGNDEPARIKLLDASGRIVFETDKKEIDISACAKGIYFIQVNNSTQKLIIH
jgi:ELWxxDGT repeat protein